MAQEEGLVRLNFLGSLQCRRFSSRAILQISQSRRIRKLRLSCHNAMASKFMIYRCAWFTNKRESKWLLPWSWPMGLSPPPALVSTWRWWYVRSNICFKFYPTLVFVREATNGRWHLTRSFRSTTFWKGWGRKASLFRLRRLAGWDEVWFLRIHCNILNIVSFIQMKLWAQSIWVPRVRTLKVVSNGSKRFSRQAATAPSGILSTRHIQLTYCVLVSI